MTTFERRQRILTLLQERENVSVKELVDELTVSEGTVRNDLNALGEEDKLLRVRGGASVKKSRESVTSNQQIAARVRHNATAKQFIAKRAATLVEDGDSILLDASTTVFHLVPFLHERRNLTIVTNGIEIARTLATNSANTIVLIGGVLDSGSGSVGGALGGSLLKGLNIKTAFVSCDAFCIDQGLTENSLQSAEIKRSMLAASQQVVALIDATKFGKKGLIPFAQLADVDQIFSDNLLDPSHIAALNDTHVQLTLCGQTTATSYSMQQREISRFRIGFGNLGEQIPFAVDVRRGLEQAALEAGNIELVMADNELNAETALHVAERMLSKQVDLFIEYQIDGKMGNLIMSRFQQAGIPVIAVDIPIVGATYFGADNYQTGRTAGVALGEWIERNWSGEIGRVIVLEETRAGALPAARMQGQLDGVQAIIGELSPSNIIHVSSGATIGTSEAQMMKVFSNLQGVEKLAILSFNDDVALGALNAARRLGVESRIAIVGQGADRLARPEIRQQNSRFIGSTTFMPEKYGEKLIEIALKILQGKAVPPATYVDHVFVSAENIDFFYPE